MKVLLINKYHYLVGGADKYYLDLSKLLAKNGHDVANFSMVHKNNLRSKWQKYFLSYVTFKGDYIKNGFRAFSRLLYSWEARKKIKALINDFRPDIAHINNIYGHLSPSILDELKKAKIPIVYTIHDYHLIHPNPAMYHDGAVCNVTKVNKYYKSIFHKCIDHSILITFPVVLALYLHRALRIYEKNVDLFISPSEFLKDKLIEYKFNSKNIIHLPNFIDINNTKAKSKKEERYVLYSGSLREHKGVQTILEAASRTPDISYKISGEGYYKPILESLSKKYNLKNVVFLGNNSGKVLTRLISNSEFCVVPSLWYENQPYSVLESYALNKTVVASKIGGIPEIVRHNTTGLLFKAGDVDDLTKKILKLWNNPETAKKMGNNAKIYIAQNFNSATYYKKIIKLYKDLIEHI